ncbi:MAG: hypothetical protein IJO33_03470 [Bacilli bacterium]|nr:hypothetical protein [Bacilli bacterium]
MEKKLPKVFANAFNKKLNNTQEIFYGNGNNIELNRSFSLNEIIKKINNIFNSSDHIFRSNVLITTKDGEKEEVIIGKTSNSILTMTGESIRLSEILDIKKK